MGFDVYKLLDDEGYFSFGEGNVVHAEKAFFAARVMKWIRRQVQTDPNFDLAAYLTMLMYYKTGMAELKFSEKDDKLLYKLTNPDQEVQAIVDSLIKNDHQPHQAEPASESATSEDVDGTPDT